MTSSVAFLRRRPARPVERPVLVSWTPHFVVEGGRTVGREAWVRFPGFDVPELVTVTTRDAA